MRTSQLAFPNVLGWGLAPRPVEDEVEETQAAQEKMTTKVSLSKILMQPSSLTAPCDNASRDAFLAIRDALNLNRGADGMQVHESTAQICPLDIRFSQPSVNFVFGSSGMEISKVVPMINIVKQDSMAILACPFPPIRCIWWEPKDGSESGWFALDNRRLLALQQRTVQAEHPHQCLAEVIMVDRLPDRSLEDQQEFCKDGYEVQLSDGSRWSWPEALAKVCEENIEIDNDNASTTASDGPGSSGHGSVDPSPVHQAMGTNTDSPLTPVSLEKALGLDAGIAAGSTKPQVLTSLEAALGLHAAGCGTPTNTVFSTAALPPPLPASAPNPVDDAWTSLQVALGMEEAANPVPSTMYGIPPAPMPDFASAMELMTCMAAHMALTQAQANGMNVGATPWSPPEEAPASPTAEEKIVELDKELAKAAAQVPVKTHLKAPYRRPTDDEIAARLQKITIKPAFTMEPVGEEASNSDKENEEPVATPVKVENQKSFRI